MAKTASDICWQCRRVPSRAADEFCGDVCARDWACIHERAFGHEPVSPVTRAETGRAWAYAGTMRVNLQNSA